MYQLFKGAALLLSASMAFGSVLAASSDNKCPPADAICTGYRGAKGYANVPNPVPCWFVNAADGYSCYGARQDGTCYPEWISMKNCHYELRQPQCPKHNDKCTGEGGIQYSFEDSSVPKCWTLGDKIGSWTCKDSSAPCLKENSSIDISECKQ